jgi:hypothetical protein
MSMRNRAGALLAVAAVALLSAACDDENTRTITNVQRPDTVTVVRTDTVRVGNQRLVFNQIERLANPLVSEALLPKRKHGFHNTTNPNTDRAFFRQDIIDFVTQIAGRSPEYGAAVADVLLPDMIMVFPNRASGVTAANSDDSPLVGWLTHVLAPNNTGYGGRKFDRDDVVDKALGAAFGTAFGNTNNVSPGLVTDNVRDSQEDPNTFPYVAPPS